MTNKTLALQFEIAGARVTDEIGMSLCYAIGRALAFQTLYKSEIHGPYLWYYKEIKRLWREAKNKEAIKKN